MRSDFSSRITRFPGEWICADEVLLPAQPPRAPEPGRLPPAGPLRLGSVEVGPGRPAVHRSQDSLPPGLWVTDDVVPGAVAAWWALAGQFPATGLWPVLVQSPQDEPGRPWDGRLEPVPEATIDALDAREVLEEAWHGWLVPINNPWAPGTGPLAPFGPAFPGLAPVQPSVGESWAALTEGRAQLGLVSCRRPADAVARAGWLGAMNRASAVEVSAVLRSWEERFGVVLAGLGFATMTLLVSRPPASDDDALRVAAEVAALCPDALWQPESFWPYEERDTTLEDLSHRLVRGHLWRLWFD